MIIFNEDLGSVITWDFDVLRHAVAFSVYQTKNQIAIASTPPTPTGSNMLEYKSVIDKSWVENKDYQLIEQSVCTDGESVQVIIH